MEAVAEAASRIRSGQDRAVLAGGAESMSCVPLLLPAETLEPMSKLARARNVWQKASAFAGLRPRHFMPVSGLELGLTDPTCDLIMGKTAEILAHEFGRSPAWSRMCRVRLYVHTGSARARRRKPGDSMMSECRSTPALGLHRSCRMSARGLKPDAVELLTRASALPGFLTVAMELLSTVGNSCQITDEAAVAMLLADGAMAKSEGMDVLGYVRGYAYAGLDPARMGLGPVYAIDQLLRQTGLKFSDILLWEINEAKRSWCTRSA